MVDCGRKRRNRLSGVAWSERAVSDSVRKRRTVNIVHREIRLTGNFANLMNGNDVGMSHASECLNLTVKSQQFVFVGEAPGANHFHCNDSIHADLPRLVNDSHPAACDFLQQFIVTEIAKNGTRPRPNDGLTARI